MAERWSNWSGSVQCEPAEITRPGSEAEVAAVVRRAAESGREVRVAGSGHSFQPLCATGGVLVSLASLAGIESVDANSRQATIRAGTVLHDLGVALHAHGLALENLGDVDVQALGGALGTGTHGTGRALGNLSSRVVALRVVGADGGVSEWSADEGAEALRAGRVSLGALGIVVAARLALVPAYRLHERVRRGPVEPVLADLEEHVAENRHFEFFYFPRHDFAEVKTLNPTDAEPGDLPDAKGERIGWSAEILPSVREERFNEMEYAVPAAAGPACFAAARERLRSRHPDVVWPVEYRTLAADDAMLSQAHGRDSVTISIHRDGAKSFREVFADLEAVFRDHEGRPHWGKIHTRGADDLAKLYPDWERFLALRRRLDPDGRFLNPHLRHLFGIGNVG